MMKLITLWDSIRSSYWFVPAISTEGKQGLVMRAFEWTHCHFPNLMDCRPIYVRRALEAAGFQIETCQIESMRVPVEIVRGVKCEWCGCSNASHRGSRTLCGDWSVEYLETLTSIVISSPGVTP